MALKIWFVDDRADNRAAWLASFPQALKQVHRFELFASVDEVFAALAIEPAPDIFFLDFFIAGRYAHEVLDYFLPLAKRPLLIAHSSHARANAGMLRYGADLALAKLKGAPATPSIQNMIRNEADLLALAARRRNAEPPA